MHSYIKIKFKQINHTLIDLHLKKAKFALMATND